jgi:hypothetical protein
MEQSLVCIIDLLGTKGIWTEESVDRYFKTIEKAQLQYDSLKKKFSKALEEKSLEFDFITFSDTIVITLINRNRYDGFFIEHIEGLSQFVLGVFQDYFSEYFFARGAISYGDIEKRDNHFIGPAIDDAAEYFELPDMIGICFTPKTTIAMDYAIDTSLKFFQREIGKFVVKYRTPLKNGMKLELYQINWVKFFIEPLADQKVQLEPLARLSQFLCKRNIPLAATSKINNTIAFFQETVQRLAVEFDKEG